MNTENSNSDDSMMGCLMIAIIAFIGIIAFITAGEMNERTRHTCDLLLDVSHTAGDSALIKESDLCESRYDPPTLFTR